MPRVSRKHHQNTGIPRHLAGYEHSAALRKLAANSLAGLGVLQRFASRMGSGPVCLLLAAGLAALAYYVLPRGQEAHHLLAIADDPAAISDHALPTQFNAERARTEIEDALAANDSDLAKSFADLAADRHLALDPALLARVDAAIAEALSMRHRVASFASGFITGRPDDGASLAGTAVGDLFVFGDIRDAAREGGRWAKGEEPDKLILGLASAGIAITAATYATAGLTAPVRAGLSLMKAARRAGHLGGNLVRLIRAERASKIVALARDVGKVEAKAGSKAALETLRIAETPAEIGRVVKLAEKEGSRTRAILKLLGRGAIMLTMGAFDLALWVFGAVATLLSFVWSLKRITERMTERHLHRRKQRLLRLALAAT
jgi:hypothetical protein